MVESLGLHAHFPVALEKHPPSSSLLHYCIAVSVAENRLTFPSPHSLISIGYSLLAFFFLNLRIIYIHRVEKPVRFTEQSSTTSISRMHSISKIAAAAALVSLATAGDAPVAQATGIGITYAANIPDKANTLSGAVLGSIAPDGAGTNFQISFYNLPGSGNLSESAQTSWHAS